jgi:hypothetical protein
MEESSHSTPSPLSSAASSQDSLHPSLSMNAANSAGYGGHYYHSATIAGYGHTSSSSLGMGMGGVGAGAGTLNAAAAAAAAKKKAGVKSTLGRIFGSKKEKQLKVTHN